MHQPDFDEFRKLLDELSAVFAKPKPDDEVTQAYFRALSNVPFETVKRCAQQHERFGKFFPKPFELRPKEDRPTETPAQSAAFDVAVKENIRNWEEMRAQDPEKWLELITEAKLARLEVMNPDDLEIRARANAHALKMLRARWAKWQASKEKQHEPE